MLEVGCSTTRLVRFKVYTRPLTARAVATGMAATQRIHYFTAINISILWVQSIPLIFLRVRSTTVAQTPPPIQAHTPAMLQTLVVTTRRSVIQRIRTHQQLQASPV